MTRQQYLDWMRAEVQKPDFLDGNFLSNEERIPIDVVQTNAARALATNAVRGHVWDNFSSETYKTLRPPAISRCKMSAAHRRTNFLLRPAGQDTTACPR